MKKKVFIIMIIVLSSLFINVFALDLTSTKIDKLKYKIDEIKDDKKYVDILVKNCYNGTDYIEEKYKDIIKDKIYNDSIIQYNINYDIFEVKYYGLLNESEVK